MSTTKVQSTQISLSPKYSGTKVSFNELETLKANAQLIPGNTYEITDFLNSEAFLVAEFFFGIPPAGIDSITHISGNTSRIDVSTAAPDLSILFVNGTLPVSDTTNPIWEGQWTVDAVDNILKTIDIYHPDVTNSNYDQAAPAGEVVPVTFAPGLFNAHNVIATAVSETELDQNAVMKYYAQDYRGNNDYSGVGGTVGRILGGYTIRQRVTIDNIPGRGKAFEEGIYSFGTDGGAIMNPIDPFTITIQGTPYADTWVTNPDDSLNKWIATHTAALALLNITVINKGATGTNNRQLYIAVDGQQAISISADNSLDMNQQQTFSNPGLSTSLETRGLYPLDPIRQSGADEYRVTQLVGPWVQTSGAGGPEYGTQEVIVEMSSTDFFSGYQGLKLSVGAMENFEIFDNRNFEDNYNQSGLNAQSPSISSVADERYELLDWRETKEEEVIQLVDSGAVGGEIVDLVLDQPTALGGGDITYSTQFNTNAAQTVADIVSDHAAQILIDLNVVIAQVGATDEFTLTPNDNLYTLGANSIYQDMRDQGFTGILQGQQQGVRLLKYQLGSAAPDTNDIVTYASGSFRKLTPAASHGAIPVLDPSSWELVTDTRTHESRLATGQSFSPLDVVVDWDNAWIISIEDMYNNRWRYDLLEASPVVAPGDVPVGGFETGAPISFAFNLPWGNPRFRNNDFGNAIVLDMSQYRGGMKATNKTLI